MEETNNNFKNDLLFLLAVVATVILIGLLTSCRTKYVTVPELHTSYIHSTDTAHVYHRDSIYRRDSVFTTIYTEGDTVYKVAHFYHYDTRWKDRVTYQSHTDTLLRVDSVSVPYPIKAELTKSQQRYITIGKWACGVGVGVVIILLTSAIWWYRKKV